MAKGKQRVLVMSMLLNITKQLTKNLFGMPDLLE